MKRKEKRSTFHEYVSSAADYMEPPGKIMDELTLKLKLFQTNELQSYFIQPPLKLRDHSIAPIFALFLTK